MATTNTSKENHENVTVGYDDLLEDLVGLNIRGLKTIWTLFRRPYDYFVAAKTPNWQDRYTPSFRVWFAVMAIGAAFKFIWAGKNSPMFNIYHKVIEDIIAGANQSLAMRDKTFDLTNFDITASTNYLLKYTQLLIPFTYFFFIVIFAAVYRAWGEKLGFVIRLRYLFAIVVPGSVIGFISAILTIPVPLEIFQWVNSLSMLAMFVSYFLVAYFGAFRHMTDGGRLGRSIVVTLAIIVVVMLASMVAVIGAMILTITQTFPETIPLIESVSP